MVGRFRVIIGMLLALLLVSGCATTTLVRPQPTPTPSPTATAQPPNPFPLTAPLDPPPTDCPATPPVQHLDFAQFGSFSGPVRFFGAPPVWIPDNEYFPHPIMHLEPPSAGPGPDPYAGFKILWEIGPNTLPPATARVTNLGTGAFGWWGNGNMAPTKVVFDIEGGIDHAEVDTGWHEWGSLLFIPGAGCYALDVSWAGGAWRTIFAAGR